MDDADTFHRRYINSMPMIFAFRIVDCFFCMGPKVLFQVGYVTILVSNGLISTNISFLAVSVSNEAIDLFELNVEFGTYSYSQD